MKNVSTAPEGLQPDAGSPAKVGRRERGKIEKRRKIVEAARHLFLTNGFDSTTTLQIAELADIGSGTLFTYARTKEDLLVMVFHDEIMAVNARSFATAPSRKKLLDQLMYVFRQMIDYHDQDLELHRRISKLMLDNTSERRHAEMVEMLALVHSGISDILRARMKSGEIRDTTDLESASRMIFSIYYMNLLLWLSGLSDKQECDDRLSRELAAAIDGLRA